MVSLRKRNVISVFHVDVPFHWAIIYKKILQSTCKTNDNLITKETATFICVCEITKQQGLIRSVRLQLQFDLRWQIYLLLCFAFAYGLSRDIGRCQHNLFIHFIVQCLCLLTIRFLNVKTFFRFLLSETKLLSFISHLQSSKPNGLQPSPIYIFYFFASSSSVCSNKIRMKSTLTFCIWNTKDAVTIFDAV